MLGSFAAVVSHAENTSAGVVIQYDEGSIRLAGLQVADLHATDLPVRLSPTRRTSVLL